MGISSMARKLFGGRRSGTSSSATAEPPSAFGVRAEDLRGYDHCHSVLWGYGTRPTYFDDFVEFLAARRGIAPARARECIAAAQGKFSGGWGGNPYRDFTELALEALRPLYDDATDAEVLETYRFHGPLDFLRMLSYAVPNREDLEPIVGRLAQRKSVAIVDYGCGLAHRTIAVSRALIERGTSVNLYLVDIAKEWHWAFLRFLCQKYGIPYEFIEVTIDRLYPDLPPHDYCDNLSVLEHVREPVRVVDNTDKALRPEGLFLALVDDAIVEMMHITPNMKAVRERLASLGYVRIGRLYGAPLLQKPAA